MAKKHDPKKVKKALYKKDPKTGGNVKKRTVQDTYDLATKLVREFSKKIDKKFPPASKVGQYPRRRTGQYSMSVEARVKGRTISIGSYAPHAKYLAGMGRKTSQDFAAEAQAKLPKYLSDLKIVGLINMRKTQ